MSRRVSEYPLSYDYPLSERQLILQGIAEAAARFSRNDVIIRVTAAQALNDQWADLEESEKRKVHVEVDDTLARTLDTEIDHHVGRAWRLMSATAEVTEHPQSEACRACLASLFEGGLARFTMVPHAEQSLKNSRFVLHMRSAGKDMAAALGLTTSVDRVAVLNEQLHQVLLRTQVTADSAALDAADEASEDAMLQVIHYLLATPSGDTKAIAERDVMLESLLQANDRLHTLYSRRVRDGRARSKARREKQACETAHKGSGAAPANQPPAEHSKQA